MGCKTKGGYGFAECSGFGPNPDHCKFYTPSSGGVTFSVKEYPQNAIRQGNYNVPGREDDAVMYPFIQANVIAATAGSTGSGTGTSAANCGKLSIADPCDTGGRDDGAVSTLYTDWFPTQLSFDYNFSDTWFSYLYDTSVNSGIVGIPCYYIETEDRTGGDGGSRQICHPCPSFTSTPAETSISYTAEEDLTGDPDCPHPTLFGIGTNSNKIVFSYDQLSTILPNGVTDFSLSYDGVTYSDAWNGSAQGGTFIEYISPQNPWQQGDENMSEFEIYDFTSGATKDNFIVKARVEPIFDDTGNTTIFSGTRWVITEFLNQGTGYAVNDVFQMTLLHTHPDNSQSTFTMNLKVTAVGPVDNVTATEGFDILRVDDTINGHKITRAFHTDEDNFQYHVAYLDGDGLDFTKDTQYTSDRNHAITVVAGYGIKDRAILIGLYEFLNKSLQFLTADINRNAPDAFNSIVQPIAFVTITNGAVTDLSFNGEVVQLDINSIKGSRKDGYSSADNVTLTGGTGSGCVVNIEVGDDGRIADVIIVNPGSGYLAGDELTIPGSVKPAGTPKNATIRVAAAARPGSGFVNLQVAPILEISPSPKTPQDDNNDAKVEATFVGGSVSSVIITKGGSGYDPNVPVSVVVNNIDEITTIIQKNDGYRANLVEEFQGMLKSLPPSSGTGPNPVEITAEDLQSIEDSYKYVPAETELENAEPAFSIKMDPDRERIDQLPQSLYSSDATAPLKAIMDSSYPLDYLQRTPVDDEFKQVFFEEQARSLEQISDDIDSITQKQIPEFKSTQETKIETCVGSFTNLPTASKFTKYIMRQYRADPAKQTGITVSLSCTPQDIGCAHITCPPPALSPGYSEEVGTGTFNPPDPETGEAGSEITETYTYSYSMSPLLGPGAQKWTATGNMTIFHDLTRAAATVSMAVDAYGNPFSK